MVQGSWVCERCAQAVGAVVWCSATLAWQVVAQAVAWVVSWWDEEVQVHQGVVGGVMGVVGVVR